MYIFENIVKIIHPTPMVEIHTELKEKYDSHYSDKTEEWRKLGAIEKARNIIELTQNLNIKNLIDVGAGDGNILSILSREKVSNSFTAAEISISAIRQINKKNISGLKDTVQFDGYSLPFNNNEFDLATCSHVLEHVEHPRILLREIKRISKYQVFEIPIDFSLNVDKKIDHFTSYGHINIYTPQLFNYLLLSEGFDIIDCRKKLFSKSIIKFQNPKITLRYCTIILKRTLYKFIPLLIKYKPNTYTVLTK